MRKRVSILLAFCIFLGALSPVAATEALPDPAAEDLPNAAGIAAAAVYNLENEQTVYAHNADTPLPPSSLTKMMTALCAYEMLGDRMDDTLTVEYSMIKDALGNQVGYLVGEDVRVRDMFGGLLVRGANDSALLLGACACGSAEAFLAKMNEKAAALGMKDTVFKNLTGMDAEGAVTTAADALRLARAFAECEELTALSTAVKYEMPKNEKAGARTLYNRNGLVSKIVEKGYFDSRITGLCAGGTAAAGNYAASACGSERLHYIIVVLGGEETDGRNRAADFTSDLCTYALTRFAYFDVIKAGKIVCEIPVRLSSDADYVTAAPEETLTVYLPTGLDLSTDLTYVCTLGSETLNAPVAERQTVGTYAVYRGETLLGKVPLVTTNAVGGSGFLTALNNIEEFTSSALFLVLLGVAAALGIAYFALRAVFGRKSAHKRKSR